MKIEAQIDKLINGKKLKAIASVSFDKMYVVKNLRVVDGDKGLFVGYPQETIPGKDGKERHSNIFFPITNMAKADIEDAVINAYRQKMGMAPQKSAGYNHSEPAGCGCQDPFPDCDLLGDSDGIAPFDMV